jgi:tetratricopeptide (TPR) repeat protein
VRRLVAVSRATFFVTLLFGLLVAALGGGGTARAEQPQGHVLSQKQRDQEKKALTAYAAGRFEEAINTYADLYAEFRDPIYLRNIGRCYQKLKVPDRAISSLEDYLSRATKISPAERDEINGYIREMKELQQAQAQANPAVPPQGAPPPGATAPPPGAPPPAAGVVQPLPGGPTQPGAPAVPNGSLAPAVEASAPPPQGPRPSSTKKIAGVAVGAAGGASLLTGIIFQFVRNSRASAFNSAGCYASDSGPATGYESCQGRYDSVQTAQTVAIVGFAGAALMGGVATYLLLADRNEAARTTTTVVGHLRCAPSPGAALVCAGWF